MRGRALHQGEVAKVTDCYEVSKSWYKVCEPQDSWNLSLVRGCWFSIRIQYLGKIDVSQRSEPLCKMPVLYGFEPHSLAGCARTAVNHSLPPKAAFALSGPCTLKPQRNALRSHNEIKISMAHDIGN